MYRKPLEMFFVNAKATLFFQIFANKIIQILTHATRLCLLEILTDYWTDLVLDKTDLLLVH